MYHTQNEPTGEVTVARYRGRLFHLIATSTALLLLLVRIDNSQQLPAPPRGCLFPIQLLYFACIVSSALVNLAAVLYDEHEWFLPKGCPNLLCVDRRRATQGDDWRCARAVKLCFVPSTPKLSIEIPISMVAEGCPVGHCPGCMDSHQKDANKHNGNDNVYTTLAIRMDRIRVVWVDVGGSLSRVCRLEHSSLEKRRTAYRYR